MSSFESARLCPPSAAPFRSDASTKAALRRGRGGAAASPRLTASRAVVSNLPPPTWSLPVTTHVHMPNKDERAANGVTRRTPKSPLKSRKVGGRAGVAKSSSISLNSTMICNRPLRGVRSPSLSPLMAGRSNQAAAVRQHQPRRESPLAGVKSPQTVVLDELDGRGGRGCDNLLCDDPPLSSTLPENTNSLLMPGDLSPYIMGEERSNGATMMSEENSNDASSIFSSGLSRGAWEPGAFGLLAQIDDSTLHSPPQPPATNQETPSALSSAANVSAEVGRQNTNAGYVNVQREVPQNAARKMPAEGVKEAKSRRRKVVHIPPNHHHHTQFNDSPSSSCSSSNSSARTTASSLACKLELESILSASASDPTLANRPVGAVLAEAGVGAEFNSVSRLKSFRPYNRHRGGGGGGSAQVDASNGQVNTDGGDGSLTTALPVNGCDNTTGGDSSAKSAGQNKVAKRSPAEAFASQHHKGTSHHHAKPQKTGSARRANANTASIPCSYKGCEKMFATKGSMRKHLQIHGPRQHSCNICQRSFIERSKLKRHLLVHSGEKPYVCSYPNCGKSFSLDFNLRTHIRSIHTGERPFECPVCKKSFSQSANLRVHTMLHKRSSSNDLKRPLPGAHQHQRKARKNRKDRQVALAIGAREEPNHDSTLLPLLPL